MLNFCLSLGLPHFFVCADDESDIWPIYISNKFDDYVPEDVVFHLFHIWHMLEDII